jgi:phage repressor protein C with HTH and peptisase S24 domain
MRMIEPGEGTVRGRVPLIGLTQAGAGRLFTDDGMPAGGPGWDEVELPEMPGSEEGLFALEVQGDSMMPLYRDGDVVIVSRTASIRKGDRVVVRLASGEVTAKELKRRTARTVELHALNHDHPDRTIPVAEIAWMARVMWLRQ